jgi:hypothetical protein
VRSLGWEVVARRLANVRLPGREAEMARIRHVYGSLADTIIEMQRPFLDLTPSDFETLKRRTVDNWAEI